MKEVSVGKKIGIFLISLFVLMLLTNVLTRVILPVKPVLMTTSSMSPTFEKGDMLFYSESSDIQIDDIVLYVSNFQRVWIPHRVVEISGENITTKGDGNIGPDPTIQKSQIIGEIIYWMPSWIYYIISYGIKLILATILTLFIIRKIKSK